MSRTFFRLAWLTLFSAACTGWGADNRPIGVFDSGIGGLTVLEKLLAHPGLKGERFTYLGDQANMPYGNYDAMGKSAYLRELAIKDALFLVSDGYFADGAGACPVGKKDPAKIVVIACNTATAYGRNAAESIFQCVGARQRVIGVINAGVRSTLRLVDAAHAETPIAIGVLATPGTISSGAYPRTVAEECAKRGVKAKVEVFSQGCPGLADAIELGTADAAKIAHDNLLALVEKYRASGTKAPLKAVILGCTHYPFLMATLEQARRAVGLDFAFVDPAVDTAEECYQALKEADLLADGRGTSGSVESFVSVPSTALPASAVNENGTLATAFKYGRAPGRDEVTTKFVRLKDGKVDPSALARLVKLLPLTRAALKMPEQTVGTDADRDVVSPSTRCARPSTSALVVGIADICRTNSLVEVGSPYAAAVYAAGAIPYLLPSTTNAAVIAALVDRIDMLLLAGGEDVAAARYGAAPHALTKVNDRRDVWEFALLDEVVRRRLPVLGICRGCQLLNVAFGGTLWQDLPTEKEGARVHRLAGEHQMTVAKGSFLAKLTDSLSSSVNSLHHQAVRVPAPGFRITATSPDGVVEAIEGADYPAMGVQFHPEKLFVSTGRREFLPLFRGAFADLKPTRPRPVGRLKLVAIPDYCPTNDYVVAKPNLTAALEMAGFASVVIPFTADDKTLAAALADADALMVAGGIGALQDYEKRCAFERRAIRLALARGIPISGVCHGSQVINTYFGGSLELTPQKKGEADFLIAHRMPVRTPYTDNFHLADLTPGSRIAAVFGSTRAIVNSSHSNRSFKMGDGLVVTARALDGVVEAFEHTTRPVMAFQFHPERLAFDPRFIELLRVSLSPASTGTP